MRLKFIPILLLVLLPAFSVIAQITFERQVIGCAGSVSTIGDLVFCQTTGEVVTWTGSQNGFSFAQGFQQPHAITTETKDSRLEVGYVVYPNPASNIVHIEFTASMPTELVINLYTLDGKLLSETTTEVIGHDNYFLDVSKLPTAIYILSIYDREKDAFATERLQVTR